MTLKYCEGIDDSSREDILKLYDSLGWSIYTGNPDGLMTALKNSAYVIACYDAGELVGLARSISDDSSIHYLQDILVHPEYHRRGIGKELISKCLKRFEHVRAHVLLTDAEDKQATFYESVGFENSKVAMDAMLNCFVKFKDVD